MADKTLIKVFIVGALKAGKNALHKALIDNESNFSEHYKKSVLSDFEPKEYQDGTAQIWHAPGEERSLEFSREFYLQTQIFLLCFNVRDRHSLDCLGDEIEAAKARSPDALFVFVGTQDDKDLSLEARRVDEATISTFIGEQKAKHQEINIQSEAIFTSAKDRKNLDKIHTLLTETIALKNKTQAASPEAQESACENPIPTSSSRGRAGFFRKARHTVGALSLVGTVGVGLFIHFGLITLMNPVTITAIVVLSVIALIAFSDCGPCQDYYSSSPAG